MQADDKGCGVLGLLSIWPQRRAERSFLTAPKRFIYTFIVASIPKKQRCHMVNYLSSLSQAGSGQTTGEGRQNDQTPENG